MEAATGNAPRWRAVDLTDIPATRAAVAELTAETGPFRALVNNAGNDDRHVLEEITPEYWDNRFAVNLRHQFFVAQAVAGPMAEAGGGSIINLGSISWMMGAAGVIAYTTAKAAVAGLTKSLARELGARKDPGQRHRAGLGADAAPGGPGHGDRAGEVRAVPGAPVPEGAPRSRRHRPPGAVARPPTTAGSPPDRPTSWTEAWSDDVHSLFGRFILSRDLRGEFRPHDRACQTQAMKFATATFGMAFHDTDNDNKREDDMRHEPAWIKGAAAAAALGAGLAAPGARAADMTFMSFTFAEEANKASVQKLIDDFQAQIESQRGAAGLCLGRHAEEHPAALALEYRA